MAQHPQTCHRLSTIHRPARQAPLRRANPSGFAPQNRHFLIAALPVPSSVQVDGALEERDAADGDLGTTIGRSGTSKLSRSAAEIEEKSVSDEVAAHLLATQTLTAQTVITGLSGLGVQYVGPLFLVQILARTNTLEEFVNAIKAVDESGLSFTKNTVFERTILRVLMLPAGPGAPLRTVERNRAYNFGQLKTMNMAPEEYANEVVQVRLLASAVNSDERLRVRLAGIMISELYGRSYSKASQSAICAAVEHDLRAEGEALIEAAINEKRAIYPWVLHRWCHYILPQRDPGKHPVHDARTEEALRTKGVDPVVHVIRTISRVADQNGEVLSSIWIECLKRLGQTGRLVELRKLTIYLANLYSGKGSDKTEGSEATQAVWHDRTTLLQADRNREQLKEIFNPVFLAAIVHWSMQHGFKPDRHRSLQDAATPHYPSQLWMLGLQLLSALRSLGHKLPRTELSEALLSRHRKLFRPPSSDESSLNHHAARVVLEYYPGLKSDFWPTVTRILGEEFVPAECRQQVATSTPDAERPMARITNLEKRGLKGAEQRSNWGAPLAPGGAPGVDRDGTRSEQEAGASIPVTRFVIGPELPKTWRKCRGDVNSQTL